MSSSVAYDLHKLGWRAFQDLCAVILQSALGQTFHVFADSNDGGRDGAFFGKWSEAEVDPIAEIPDAFLTAGATVAQCKFSVNPGGTLTPSALGDELDKVDALVKDGLCDAYILLTNQRVSGKTEAWLRKELLDRGVHHVIALDGGWISQQIALRPELRRYVPRVYGLGDLGQILDERRLEQARALMSRLAQDLTTFVPTGAYKQAAKAITEQGFTLLLGAPAAGKSTIAATLAIAALDEWKASVRRVDSAAELIAAWNPNEPDQLFWVDDAFGAIRHDQQLTDEWSRRLDQVMTLITAGARVVMTSRDYIYKEARAHLKHYAYPVLRENLVVVDVAELTEAEKERILYNHLKAGDQPSELLERWRPHLPALAKSRAFQPEVARRLGLRTFTANIGGSSEKDLLDFVERPMEFLRDVIGGLDAGDIAALACVYMSGAGLEAPVRLGDLAPTIAQMGSTPASVVPAFERLSGTFLSLAQGSGGDQSWVFRHPTVREAFAAYIATSPNFTEILLRGLTDDELFRQVDCGGVGSGTLINVPSSLYGLVISRASIASLDGESRSGTPMPFFLQQRTSDGFLRQWAEKRADELRGLLNFGAYMHAYWQPGLLGRLTRAGALPEEIRRAAVEKLSEMAIEFFDSDWMSPPISWLFTDEDRDELLERFRDEVLPDLEHHVAQSADGYDAGTSSAERYRRAESTLRDLIDAFAEDEEALGALEVEAESVARASLDEDDWYDAREREPLYRDVLLSRQTSSRDPFEDVSAGH